MGLRKDNRGLFTDISQAIDKPSIETIFFDYGDYNAERGELSIFPFSSNVKRLQNEIDLVLSRKSEAKIVIIGQSQGCIIPTLCNLTGVSQIIGISPFFHTKINDIRKRYTSNSGNELNFSGISKRKRSDGTTTLIPPEYWKERFETDVVRLYNEAALKTRLTLICALQDEIMEFTELKLIKYARIINTDGDHDFSGQHRSTLINIIKTEIWNKNREYD